MGAGLQQLGHVMVLFGLLMLMTNTNSDFQTIVVLPLRQRADLQCHLGYNAALTLVLLSLSHATGLLAFRVQLPLPWRGSMGPCGCWAASLLTLPSSALCAWVPDLQAWEW